MYSRSVGLAPARLSFTMLLCCAAALAQAASQRFTLILEDPPVSSRFPSSEAMRSNSAVTYRDRIEARQKTLRAALASRNIAVTGSVNTLLNAIFVTASSNQVAELKKLPGVIGVVRGRFYYPNLNRATQLVNAPAAWNILGGVQNSGRGIKIAILDSGIDQTHPAFQDSSLPMPSGDAFTRSERQRHCCRDVVGFGTGRRGLCWSRDPASFGRGSARSVPFSGRDRCGRQYYSAHWRRLFWDCGAGHSRRQRGFQVN